MTSEDMVPCDIYKAMQKIRYPETQEWAVVEIHGNVTLLDENCDLNRILEKSVKKNQENVISGLVGILCFASSLYRYPLILLVYKGFSMVGYYILRM